MMQSHPVLTVGTLIQSQCRCIYSLGGVLLDANGALGTNRRNMHRALGASVSVFKQMERGGCGCTSLGGRCLKTDTPGLNKLR